MSINSNDCIACLVLLTVTSKMDRYRNPMPPLADYIWASVYELVSNRCQVSHCFGVLVSRAEPSLGDCHDINVGTSDMVSENVCFIVNGTGVEKAQHDS